ncbi:hypothetical protein PFISCL1PPCAC_11453, partial [Pristionchus fissidentatus]
IDDSLDLDDIGGPFLFLLIVHNESILVAVEVPRERERHCRVREVNASEMFRQWMCGRSGCWRNGGRRCGASRRLIVDEDV